jgi:hypothetical protein
VNDKKSKKNAPIELRLDAEQLAAFVKTGMLPDGVGAVPTEAIASLRDAAAEVAEALEVNGKHNHALIHDAAEEILVFIDHIKSENGMPPLGILYAVEMVASVTRSMAACQGISDSTILDTARRAQSCAIDTFAALPAILDTARAIIAAMDDSRRPEPNFPAKPKPDQPN